MRTIAPRGPTRTAPAAAEVIITEVGADGDGIAGLPEGDRVYLPYTLPGEQVRATGLARHGDGWLGAAAIAVPSPDRQLAPCPHFGTCGGCTLQHWQDAPYAQWKTARLRAALDRAGFRDTAIAPLARTPPATRRRVDLALQREGGAVRVGLHRHRGAEVADLQTCLVLDPALVRLLDALRTVLPGLAGLRRTGSAVANLLDSGIDLLLRTDAPLSPADRIALTAFARAAGACRVAWASGNGEPETACQLVPAIVTLAGAVVSPPPGAFLQASPQGEAAITGAVLAGLPPPSRRPVIELFAGVGTLTFALAEYARVVAYEGHAGSHAALRSAIAGRRIEAFHRDLVRQPLAPKELAGAAAVVLDPPFAGAAAQMPSLVASRVPRIVYVSCNPAALARDSKMLHAGGYRAVLATPVDQFLWSAAVESVIVFELPRRAG